MPFSGEFESGEGSLFSRERVVFGALSGKKTGFDFSITLNGSVCVRHYCFAVLFDGVRASVEEETGK